MTTTENNKLIAEFMGLESFKDSLAALHQGKINVDVDVYEQAQYHTSWDWLMPVVDKCYQEHMSKHIAEAVMTCNIDEAYKVVLEFIKEYNADSEDDACDKDLLNKLNQ